MMALVGLLLVANFASIDVPPALQYLVYGGFVGAMGGTELVVRRERREGEMPPDRVRHVMRIAVGLGVVAGALAVAVQVALALL